MKYKNIKTVLLILISPMFGCHAQAEQLSPEFRAVFATISSVKALKSSFGTVMTQLKGICTERHGNDMDAAQNGNVSCIEAAEVSELTMSGTKTPVLTMIQGSFNGAEKCAYMKSELIKAYGKPSSLKGKCNSQWLIKGDIGKPMRILALEQNIKENIVYLNFEEEQGP